MKKKKICCESEPELKEFEKLGAGANIKCCGARASEVKEFIFYKHFFKFNFHRLWKGNYQYRQVLIIEMLRSQIHPFWPELSFFTRIVRERQRLQPFIFIRSGVEEPEPSFMRQSSKKKTVPTPRVVEPDFFSGAGEKAPAPGCCCKA